MASKDDIFSSDSEYWSGEDDSQEDEPLREGATYPSASAIVHAAQDVALKQGKSVVVKGHGGADRKIVCSTDGCPFTVKAYRRSKIVNGKREWQSLWQVSMAHLVHENCFSTAKPTARQIASMKCFASALRAGYNVSANTLIDQVRETEGVSLSNVKRTVYRAIDRAKEATEAEIRVSYGKIESYLAAFERLNPGCLAVAEKDECSRFKRAVVVVGPFIRAVDACQKVVGIDCSHSKSRFFSGVQVHLVGRDSNLENVTIAFGMIPAEDTDSYLWFLAKVASAGFDLSDIPVYSDRGSALVAAAQVMPIHLRFCTLHIVRNVVHKFGKLSRDDKNHIWALQASETEGEYKSRLDTIGRALGVKIRDYLKEISPDRWCVFANRKKKKLYGWRTSNFVESVFGSQLVSGTRRLAPFDFIKRLCEKLLEDCYRRANNGRLWEERGSVVTPGAMRLFRGQSKNIGAYLVMKSCNDVSFVVNTQTTTRKLRCVTFSTRSCTCAFFDQYGVPCRHLVAALSEHSKASTVYDYFDKCYHVSVYREAFDQACIRLPLDCDYTVDSSWLPPLVKARRGRPKTKRIRSNGE